MPLVTVTNLSSTIATCVSDTDGYGLSIELAPSAVVAQELTPRQFEAMAKTLTSMRVAGLISYTVAQSAVLDNLVDVGSPVAAADLATASVTFVKAAASVSAEQTGTGASQNVAHGLGVTPTLVLAVPTNVATNWVCTYGAHTSTNSVVTVTTGGKFKVLAWA